MLVLDVVAACVVIYAFLLRRPFIEGKWRVSLASNDWGKRDPPGEIVFELFLRVEVDFIEGLSVGSCSLAVVPS